MDVSMAWAWMLLQSDALEMDAMMVFVRMHWKSGVVESDDIMMVCAWMLWQLDALEMDIILVWAWMVPQSAAL